MSVIPPPPMVAMKIYLPPLAQVLTARRLDRGVQAPHALLPLSLTCRDHGTPSLHASLALPVRVADLNDHSPQFLPPGGARRYVAVRENGPAGELLLTLSAQDGDSGAFGRVEYTLGGNSSGVEGLVEVDGATGAVRSRHVVNGNLHCVYIVDFSLLMLHVYMWGVV